MLVVVTVAVAIVVWVAKTDVVVAAKIVVVVSSPTESSYPPKSVVQYHP